jgi:hypothetical protein
MEELFLPEFTSRIPELLDEVTALLALHFTREELRTLTEFYVTPVGQKLVEKMPILRQQIVAMGEAWGERVGREVTEKNIDKIRGRGLRI